jgi:hypothetical protein
MSLQDNADLAQRLAAPSASMDRPKLHFIKEKCSLTEIQFWFSKFQVWAVSAYHTFAKECLSA